MTDLVEIAQNVQGMKSWRKAHGLPPTQSDVIADALKSYHKRTGVKREPRPGKPQLWEPVK